MSHDAWIQQSLERLEALEAHKAALQSHGMAVPPAVQAEIAQLYQALDAAAGPDDAAAAAPPQPAAPFGQPAPGFGGPGYGHAPIPQPTAPHAVVPQPQVAQPQWGQPAAPAGFGSTAPQPVVAPFAAPAGAFGGFGNTAPQHVVPPQAGVPAPTYDTGSMGSMMIMAPKSKAPMVLGIVAAVALVGGGGFSLMQNSRAGEPTPEGGDAAVIGASSVPDDTEEPDAAEGADVSRTQGTRFKEGTKSRGGGGGTRRTGGGDRGGSDSDDKDAGHKIKVTSDSRDPLAGLK